MWRAHTNRKPAFFWQGVLIVMPVAVLATLGFVSLRQDRLLAQREAAERAQSLAEDLAPKIWNDLIAVKASDAPPGRSFLVDSAGGLLFPPPCPPLPPAQPFNPAELNPAQAALWLAAQRAETGGDPATAVQAYRDFLQSNPPQNFAATADYALGLLLIRQVQLQAAAEMFELVLDKFPDALGESGLPLRPMALWKLYELSRRAPQVSELQHTVSLSALCSNAVNFPSPIAEQLMDRR